MTFILSQKLGSDWEMIPLKDKEVLSLDTGKRVLVLPQVIWKTLLTPNERPHPLEEWLESEGLKVGETGGEEDEGTGIGI